MTEFDMPRGFEVDDSIECNFCGATKGDYMLVIQTVDQAHCICDQCISDFGKVIIAKLEALPNREDTLH